MPVVVLPLVRDRLAGGLERDRVDDPLGEQRPLEGGQPPFVVPVSVVLGRVRPFPLADLPDQPGAERLEVDDTRVVQRDGDAERATLPRLGEDELAVRARGRAGVSGETRSGSTPLTPAGTEGRCRSCCRA